ncbi:DUF1573 domain-containing protein [Schlesneria paludicola]|uniref:DUF1573 domain-containing protein n=1 Tax=Schlesneria paludicola TaxID=360056 RepID=UPI00029ABB6B|nr:DUF1573 domain-containing protein [Schlesneria paludicola]
MRAFNVTRCGLVICLIVLTDLNTTLFAVEIEQALAVVSRHEAEIQSVQFHCDFKTGEFESIDDLSKFRVEFEDRNSSLTKFDFDGRRFFCHSSRVSYAIFPGNTPDKAKGFQSSLDEYANDGKVFQHWYRHVLTESGAPPAIPDLETKLHQGNRQGFIATAADEDRMMQGIGYLKMQGLATGMIWAAPFIWPEFEIPQKLSEFIRDKTDPDDTVSVNALDDGLWEIIVVCDNEKRAVPYKWTLTYDPIRGRPMTVFWECYPKWRPRRKAFYEYDSPDAKFPSRVVLVTLPLGKGGIDGEWRYRDVEINPKLSDADFKLSFPKGTEVTDHTRQRTYIAGESAVDDDKAVRAFMESQGLNASPKTELVETKKSGFLLLLGINGVLVFALLIFLWRRSKRSVAGLLLVLGICSEASAAGPLQDQKSNMSIGHESQYTTQCGMLSTLFILRHFDLNYSLNALDASFHPDDRGIPMSEIVSVLEAYGLECHPRKGVTVRDVTRMVDRGYLALIPVTLKNGRGHYLVGVKHAKTNELLAVDVPTLVAGLDQAITDAKLKETNGVVAFVSQNPRRPQRKIDVRFDQSVIDLGEIHPSDTAIRTVDAELVNHSASPVIVDEILTSCGCTTPNWTCGLIGANEKKTISFKVSVLGWTSGKQTKTVKAKLTGGDNTNLFITGTGVDAQQVHGIFVSPKKIEVDATSLFLPANQEPEAPQFKFVVTGDADSVAALRSKTGTDWLESKVNVLPNDAAFQDSLAEVVVSVLRNEASRSALQKGRTTCQLSLFKELLPNDEPIKVAVVVTRKPMAKLKSSIQEPITSGESASVEIASAVPSIGHKMALKSIKSSPEGLLFSHSQLEDGSIRIQIDSTTKDAAQTYLVTCEVEQNDPNVIDVIGFPVQVRSPR